MELFHRAPFIGKVASGSMVTIGNFDGMHLGHQALLTALIAQAKVQGLASTVVLFEPQPCEYFQNLAAPGRLMCLREKLTFLQNAGIDQVVCLGFDQTLAALSAQAFVEEIAVKQLHLQHLLVGDDFRFGRGRLGDFALLTRYAEQGAFQLTTLDSYFVASQRVSSSEVRRALNIGDLSLATMLLGRIFSVTEKVIAGLQRGRTLAFPTLNMALHRRVVPLKGVFAVTVKGVSGKETLFGVANLGVRPTVGGEQYLLETHVFDFNEDLYDQRLTVEFHHKLRDEVKFASFDALKAQIAQDCLAARRFFGV